MVLLSHQLQQRRPLYISWGFFIIIVVAGHILTNFINEKQMATVSLAQFTICFLQLVRSKALFKDYSYTAILWKAKVLALIMPSTYIHKDTYKEICLYYAHTKHRQRKLSMINNYFNKYQKKIYLYKIEQLFYGQVLMKHELINHFKRTQKNVAFAAEGLKET